MKSLAKTLLPTLADEIIGSFSELSNTFSTGPLAPDVAAFLGADVASVRRAFEVLENDGRAKIVRRKRALHLVRPDYPGRICVICRVEFTATRKKTRTCSHSCGRHLAWQNEDMRARHRVSVTAAKADPASREHFSKINKARCNTPEERQLRSERNRRSWKDPESRAKRLLAIEDAWKGDKAKGRIEKARNKKLALWSDQDWRERTRNAMLNGRRGRFKRAVIAVILGNPEIEAWQIAPRVGLTVAQVKLIWRRAVRLGEVERKPQDGRGRRRKDLNGGSPNSRT